MSNTNRQRGDYLERQTRAALEECGWIVFRSAGSLGAADLVALRYRFTPLFIACKLNGRISPAERAALCELAEAAHVRPLVASRTRRGWVDLNRVSRDGVGLMVDQVKVPKRSRQPVE